MNKREQFKKAVIMGNHPGLSYEEALEKELVVGCMVILSHSVDNSGFYKILGDRGESFGKHFWFNNDPTDCKREIRQIIGLPITIGRVIQALQQFRPELSIVIRGLQNKCEIAILDYNKITHITLWQLTKDGKELTDDDQSDKTIEALLKLLIK